MPDGGPTLTASAPAKLNLVLQVGPLRPDGFHEVRTLTVRIGMFDRVTIALLGAGAAASSGNAPGPVAGLACDAPGIPVDRNNLAWRAAEVLHESVTSAPGAAPRALPPVQIELCKQIPAGAGLGGGSSNAAAVLALLNRAWGLDLDWRALARIGARLGSDVPLFLAPSAVSLGEGRGADVTPLPNRIAGWAAVLLSGVHCATPAVYRRFDELPRPDAPADAHLDQVLRRLRQDGDTVPVPASECRAWLVNDLEPAALSLAPALAELAARVAAATGLRPQLTGSGSALFQLFDTQAEAAQYGARARHAAVGIGVALAPLEPA